MAGSELIGQEPKFLGKGQESTSSVEACKGISKGKGRSSSEATEDTLERQEFCSSGACTNPGGWTAGSAQCFVQTQRCARICPLPILQPLQRCSLKVWLLCFIDPARLPAQFSFSAVRSFMNMEGEITCVETTAFSSVVSHTDR